MNQVSICTVYFVLNTSHEITESIVWTLSSEHQTHE